MTAARRLAAILAADVVGYSRLMGEDEAGTALSVREHREAARPLVAGFGGRIVCLVAAAIAGTRSSGSLTGVCVACTRAALGLPPKTS